MCGADMVASWPIDLHGGIQVQYSRNVNVDVCIVRGLRRTVASLRMHDACRRHNLRGRLPSSPREEGESI